MSNLDDLLRALALEPVGDRRFRAVSVDEGHGIVFGGQLLAQSTVAGRTVDPNKEVQSIHLLFARSAVPSDPLDIEVEPLHTGRSFAGASVTISQGGRLCTRATVLLHLPDADLIHHSVRMPAVVPAEACSPRNPGSWWDVRFVGDVDLADPDAVGPPELAVWSRVADAPDDALTSQALLAYASDGFLIGTAMRPHPGVGQAQAHVSVSTTVLSHTLTYHEPFAASDWLLLAHHSDHAGRGRAFGRAEVHTADGRHVASFSQEAMIRSFAPGTQPADGTRARH